MDFLKLMDNLVKRGLTQEKAAELAHQQIKDIRERNERATAIHESEK